MNSNRESQVLIGSSNNQTMIEDVTPGTEVQKEDYMNTHKYLFKQNLQKKNEKNSLNMQNDNSYFYRKSVNQQNPYAINQDEFNRFFYSHSGNDAAIKNKLKQKKNCFQQEKSFFFQSYKKLNGILEPENKALYQKMMGHFNKAKEIGVKEKIKQIFVQHLENTEQRRMKKLNQRHLEIINDQSIYLRKQIIFKSFSQKFSYAMEVIEQWISNIFGFTKPFHPYNWLNLLNNLLENVIILVWIFLYSLFIFFKFYDAYLFRFFGIFSILIFTSGILLRLNTGYFDQGLIIYERNKIINRYRKDLLVYDVVGFLAQIYQVSTNDTSYLTKIVCLFFLSKYKIFSYNMEKIEERMNLKGNKVYFYEVVKLMSYALMLCHIVGSLYFFLAVIEQEQFDSENTWVQELNLESSPVRHQYIESYYWALATMTLIGTKGSTEIETAFCIIMLSWTIGIFAAILSTVSNVYQEQQAKYKDFKKDRDILNSFFEINNLPNDLQGQLQNYLKYKNQGHSEMQANVNFQHLISTFPANLQNLVREKRYSHLIQQFSLLTKNFSQKTIKVLIENLNEEYFMPGQMINKKDEQQKDAKLYLVVNGNAEAVQITHKNCYSSLKLYEPGDFFGQEQFFANQPPIYYIRSSEGSYTTCISIKQSAFIKIISQQGYEEDREKFYIIKDQLKFQDISQLLNNECYLCNQERHSEKNCNLLFYNPNKVNFLAKLSFSHINERNENFLRMGKKFQLLKSLDGLQKYQQFILQDPNLRKYLKILQEYQRILEDQLEQDSIQKFSEQDQSSFEIDNSSSSSDFFDELQQENSGDFERIQSKFIIGDQFGLLAQHKKNESNQSISVVHSQNYNNKQNLSKLENEMDLNGFKNKSKKNMTFKNELNDSFGDVNSQQQQQKNEISPFIIKIQKTKSEEENIIVANQLYQKEQFSNNENQQQQLQQNQQLQKSKQYKKWQSHFKAALSKHLKFVKNLQNEELEIQFNLGLFSKGYQNSLISLNQRNSHLTQKSNSSKVNSQSLSVTNNQQAEERVINSKTSIQEMDENSFSLKSSKSKVSGILKNSLNSKNSQKSKKHKKKKQSQDTYKENGKQKEEIKISLKSHNNFLNDPNYNQLKNYGQFDVSPQNYDSSKNVKNSQDQKEGPRKVTYSTKCLNFGENDNYSKKNIKNKMSSFFIQHSPASQKDRYYFNNKEINNSILQNESQRQQVNNKKNYNFVQKGSYSQKNLFQDSEKDNFSFKYLASRRNAVDKSNIVQNSPYGQFNSNLRHVEEMIKELYFEFQKSQNIQLEKLNENQIAIDQGLHQNEFFIDLDKMMEYQYYFVHNNYTQTLMSYKEAILRKVKRNVIIEKKQPRKKNRGDTKNFMGSNPFKEKNYKF